MRLFVATLAVCLSAVAAFAVWAHGAPDRRLALLEQDLRIEPLDVLVQGSHVGIVLPDGQARVVWDASGVTPLARWVARAQVGFEVYRFDDEVLSSADRIAASLRELALEDGDMPELVARAVKQGAGITLRAQRPVIRSLGGRLVEDSEPEALTESPRLRKVAGALSRR